MSRRNEGTTVGWWVWASVVDASTGGLVANEGVVAVSGLP